jgi:molybdopterin-guanine dinucleotide biosynthesis protein A
LSWPYPGDAPDNAGLDKVGEDAVGFVLAGGRSSRMGADKPLVRLGGQLLLAHSIRILREAGLTASIAGGKPELAAFAPLVEDRQPGLGPLSGVCSALASTTARWAVFTSVDLPLLPASLVACLLRHARITGSAVAVPSVNGFAQTFPAVVAKAALPALERELSAGRGGCFSGFEAAAADLREPVAELQVELLAQCGQIDHPRGIPSALWFLNVNTVEDLRRAEVHCGATIA